VLYLLISTWHKMEHFSALLRGPSQKKCTHWQHCVSNDVIYPTISAVVLQNFRQLVQCNLSLEVCALGNDSVEMGDCSCLR